MRVLRGRKGLLVALTGLTVIAAATVGVVLVRGGHEPRLPWGPKEALDANHEKTHETYSQGVANGGSGGEAFEALTASTQFHEARTAPSGIVAPGAYTSAFNQLTGLATAGGAWSDVTATRYDSDDPNYRDFFSNSSGGAGGLVTGRITGLTADSSGHVYVAGANGGVWRSSTGGGNWTPIADGLPSLSSGDLQLDASGALWFATGEAKTPVARATSAAASIGSPTRRPASSRWPTASVGRSSRARRSTRSGSRAPRSGLPPCAVSTPIRARMASRPHGRARSRPTRATCPVARMRATPTLRTRTSSTTSLSTRRARVI